MRSTFWPNRIFQRQSSQNRHLGLKFSSKRENSALSPWKLYKTLLSGHAQHVLAKSHFWASKFSKSSRGPEILSKTRKQCAFHENFTRRSFQVMRISSKQKNSALSKKIVQNPLFRSCAARFGQIWFLSAKVPKIVKLASNFRQNWKTVRFPWKLYKTLFSGHAQHVLAKSHFWAANFSNSWNWPQILFKADKECAFQVMRISSKQKNCAHFWASKFLKSSHWPEILFKSGKQRVFHENCPKRFFQVMRSTFWSNRILERQSSQNSHAGLKFSPKRENSAPFMKIAQNAFFRSCAALFGQI